MKYQRSVLIQKAREVRALHVKQQEAMHARKMEQYEKQLKRWQEVEKPETLDLIKKITDRVKKDQPYNSYAFRNDLHSPPEKPELIHDMACVPAIANLDMLIEVLDTVTDDEITATALARAGVKDLTRILRKPC